MMALQAIVTAKKVTLYKSFMNRKHNLINFIDFLLNICLKFFKFNPAIDIKITGTIEKMN